jgi:fucose permease
LGTPAAINGLVGLFVLGLGVALLYPLTLGLAMGAAGTRADTASARAALAGALGILVTPALLGGVADKVGLRLAHLIVPGLVLVALFCFVIALKRYSGRLDLISLAKITCRLARR